MHTDYLGANLNLTQYVDSQSSYNIEMYDDAENKLTLTNCTATLYVTDTADGTVYKGGTALIDNVLTLFFPALTAGNYRYEIALTYDDGSVRPLLGGRVLVLSSAIDYQRVNGLNPTIRTVRATIPASVAKYIELQCLATTTAEIASKTAQQAVENAKNLGNEAVERIAEAEQKIAEAETLLQTVMKTTDSFNDDIRNVLTISDSGTWVIAGTDTLTPARGENGKSPTINTQSGTWLCYDDETQTWYDTLSASRGENGKSPFINGAGNWAEYVNNEWIDTGVRESFSEYRCSAFRSFEAVQLCSFVWLSWQCVCL